MKNLYLLAIILLLPSCTDAFWDSNFGKLGEEAKIKCYSGTKLIYEGESTGAVSNASRSDGYQFREKGSDRFLEVSGNCIIEYND